MNAIIFISILGSIVITLFIVLVVYLVRLVVGEILFRKKIRKLKKEYQELVERKKNDRDV